MMARIAFILVVLNVCCGWATWQLKQTLDVRTRELDEAVAIRQGLEAALVDLRSEAARSDEAALAAARKADALAVRARTLDKQLREALRHETRLDLDTPLPAALSLALCLRWQAAAGRTETTSDPGKPNRERADTAFDDDTSAVFCDPWTDLTLRDALEWLGLLLDHAGAERIDKAGLRDWAECTAQ